MTLDDLSIGIDTPPFVIAEIGANHDGSAKKAAELVDMAARAGAPAVKFQTYTAEDLVADYDRIVTWGPPGATREESIGALFDRVKLPRSAHKDLFDQAKDLGMIGFSTPFSPDGVEFLESLDVPLYKIASSDVSYKDLLKAVAETGKPIILSTGKATLFETERAVEYLRANGAGELIILHCLAMYPAPDEDMSLNTIPAFLKKWPKTPIGLSDHSHGITACLGAVALGATVIEKHVTYSKDAVGPDHWFSSDEEELRALVREATRLHSALGAPRIGVLPSEKDERKYSVRSLVAATDIETGSTITADHLKAVRPGYGLNPFEEDKLIGKEAIKPIKKNTVITEALALECLG